MVKQRIEYLNELRCEAVRGPSGTHLVTDAPTDNHGRGESFSPTDLIATALATCQLTTIGIAAQNDGIVLTGSRIDIEKEMSADQPRRIVHLGIRFHFCPGIPETHRRRYEQIARSCPVAQSLNPSIRIDVRFEYGEEKFSSS
jgi:putative redox protein